MTRLFLTAAALAMSTGAMAADVSFLSLERSATPTSFTMFRPSGEMLISITMDGKITYGPHYAPDAAAKRFWEAVSRIAPCRIKK